MFAILASVIAASAIMAVAMVPEMSVNAGCVAEGTPAVEMVLIHLLVTAAKD
jgi:hypothetical protein